MRALRRYLPLILATGVAVWVFPALAQGGTPPATGSFTAVDDQWNAAGGGSTVTIGKGGTVSFGYPSGGTSHNVVFDSKAPQSCTQTGGPSSGGVPPLPHSPTSPGWTGTCTFSDLGDYKFHCGLHGAAMTGTVKVVADTTTTGPAAKQLKLKKSQRGTSIKGSIEITGAGSSLDVRAFARRQDLGEPTTGQQRRVGRFVRFSLDAKRASFKVKLNKKAKRALSRKGKLRITVTITVTPTGGGAKYTKQKTVTLRPSS